VAAFVVVLGCSEPGAGVALAEFLDSTYPGARREDFLLPGGPWWVARAAPAGQSRVGKWIASGARHRLADLLQGWIERRETLAFEIAGHEGCSWYEREYPSISAGERVRRQGEDVVAAVSATRGLLRVPVRGRFAGADGAVATIV
jgi:hypothetical protein